MNHFKKLSRIIVIALLSCWINVSAFDTLVISHYLGWYGDSANGSRHWSTDNMGGHADTPLIGLYDSHQKSLLTYHALLGIKTGINAYAINCVDAYDYKTASLFSQTIKFWSAIDSGFKIRIVVSYDDQAPTSALVPNLQFIRDSLVNGSTNYLTQGQKPVLFVFDYAGHYGPDNYRTIADTIFKTGVLLAWNESQDTIFKYVDACYPWVQPYAGLWDALYGLEWGSRYITDFIWRINNLPQKLPDSRMQFAVGGVWPGFDDRKCIWGKNRFISRRNNLVYDSTWIKYLDYKESMPIPSILICSANDFNESTEIEPTKEYRYQYLLSTIKNVNAFKHSRIPSDTLPFFCATKIYKAYNLIETGARDSAQYFPRLVSAVKNYLHDDYSNAITLSDSIIGTGVSVCNFNNTRQWRQTRYQVKNNRIRVALPLTQSGPVSIRLFDLLGKCLYSSVQTANYSGQVEMVLPSQKMTKGACLLRINSDNEESIIKLLLLGER